MQKTYESKHKIRFRHAENGNKTQVVNRNQNEIYERCLLFYYCTQVYFEAHVSFIHSTFYEFIAKVYANARCAQCNSQQHISGKNDYAICVVFHSISNTENGKDCEKSGGHHADRSIWVEKDVEKKMSKNVEWISLNFVFKSNVYGIFLVKKTVTHRSILSIFSLKRQFLCPFLAFICQCNGVTVWWCMVNTRLKFSFYNWISFGYKLMRNVLHLFECHFS